MKFALISCLCYVVGLSACSSVSELPAENSAPVPFEPSISSDELCYILSSIENFLKKPGLAKEGTAKQFLLEAGGLRNRILTVQFPDESNALIKFTPDNKLFISGYNHSAGLWVSIYRPSDSDFYGVNIGDPPGPGMSAELEVSVTGGKVIDKYVMIACPAPE